MTGWAIVAIPRKDSECWRYSSEKIPHLTLLMLGDPDANVDEARVAQYVQHIAESTKPFGLDVDYRDTLGPDNADVLFFDKDGYSINDVKTLRDYFLADPDIFRMYNSVEQYPEWTPHLTMGYPETPAKPDERDYPGIHWVFFDQLALWTGDYEGPSFRLEESKPPMSLAYSDESALAFLAHYGVKGMHWGVRKGTESAGAVNTREEVVRTTGTAKKPLGFTAGGKYAKKNADTAVTVQHTPGQRLATKGGSNRKPHPDAVDHAVNRRIAKSSTTDALSDQQLQKLVNRLNMEQQYSKLTAEPPHPAKVFVKAMLGDLVKQEAKGYAQRQLSDVLVKQGMKPPPKEKKKKEANA